MSRKELVNVFENLEALMRNDLTKGPGVFQLPGLLKVILVKKKAVPARKGTNPFTGEEMMFKAKPARNVVRARPLKGLKDMVK
jgi:nucleoid DNA-binding protein